MKVSLFLLSVLLFLAGNLFASPLGTLADHRQLTVTIQFLEKDDHWHPIHIQWDATGEKPRYLLGIEKPSTAAEFSSASGGSSDGPTTFRALMETVADFPIRDFFTSLSQACGAISVPEEKEIADKGNSDVELKISGGGTAISWQFSGSQNPAASQACRKAYEIAAASLSDGQKAELAKGAEAAKDKATEVDRTRWSVTIGKSEPKLRTLMIVRNLAGDKKAYALVDQWFDSRKGGDKAVKIDGPKSAADFCAGFLPELRMRNGPLAEPSLYLSGGNSFMVEIVAGAFRERIDVENEMAETQAKFLGKVSTEMRRYFTEKQKQAFDN